MSAVQGDNPLRWDAEGLLSNQVSHGSSNGGLKVAVYEKRRGMGGIALPACKPGLDHLWLGHLDEGV